LVLAVLQRLQSPDHVSKTVLSVLPEATILAGGIPKVPGKFYSVHGPAQRRAPTGFSDRVPYVLVIVRLDEGVQLMQVNWHRLHGRRRGSLW